MAPRALVSIPDAVAVLKEYIIHFKKRDTFPVYSSMIWKKISRDLDGKWTPHNVYVNVKNNRRNILSIACEELGIAFPDDEPNVSIHKSTLEDSGAQSADESFEIDGECTGLDEFGVYITANEWMSMQQDEITYRDGRTYSTLRKGVWTSVIFDVIQRQTDLPCCFDFDHHKLARSSRATHYLKVRGHCRSQKCQNPLYCYIDAEPGENQDVHMIVKTRNTLGIKHEDLRRQLRGQERKKAGEEGFYKGCGNFLKEQVKKKTKFGGRVPPQIPKLEALRQAKKEFSNDLYGIEAGKKNVVENLVKMRYDSKYHGFIHQIVEDKFFVSFSTPQQLHAYNQYCKISRNYSSISVDGTGSLVHKVDRYNKTRSGHIFLYSIVINFDGVSASVHDLLTEAQDTDTLSLWIKRWQDMGALKPKQVVCDSSRALLNGLCLALNFQTVKVYNETCFLYASGDEEFHYRPQIFTYLRLDVAHLQIQVRRWTCFQLMRFAKVRHFFMYCFSLMIDCQTLEEFKAIFSLTCIVAAHEHQDTVVKNGLSVLEARKELERKIAQRNYPVEDKEEKWDGEEDLYDESVEEKQSKEHSRVKAWINGIHENSRKISYEGSEPNPFYFNDFIVRFIPLAVEFCLWTSVSLPFTRGRASSSFSEGHFSDVKNRVLKNFSGLIRADKFVKIMLDNGSTGATLLHSKLKICHENEGPCPSPPPKNPQSEKDSPPQCQVYEEYQYGSSPFLSPTSTSPTECDHEQPKENPQPQEEMPPQQQLFEKNQYGPSPFPSPTSASPTIFDHQQTKEDPEPQKETSPHQQKFQKNPYPPPTSRTSESGTTGDEQPTKENNSSLQGDVSFASDKFYDNPWHQKFIPKRTGVYSKAQPDIRYQNDLESYSKKPWLLRNGNRVKKPTLIGDKYYFTTNTCGFDSIVHILAKSAMDDTHYLESIKNTKNHALLFVKDFVIHGPTTAVENSRVKLLVELFKTTKLSSIANALQSYSINLYGTLTLIWKRAFSIHPSLVRQYECSDCGNYSVMVPTLQINHSKFKNPHGFEVLRDLQSFNEGSRFACRNSFCRKECKIITQYSNQIFVELDVRPNLTYTSGKSGKLKEFPTTLTLNDNRYRLAGVIAHRPGHFVAYCLRNMVHWQLHDDLEPRIIPCTSSTVVVPEAVIYVKCLETNEFDGSQGRRVTSRIVGGSNHVKEHQFPQYEDFMTHTSNDCDKNIGTSSLDNPSEFIRRELPCAAPTEDPDTISRDNWRCKEKRSSLDTDVKEFYTTDNSEHDKTNIESVKLLQSGEILPGVVIGEELLHISQTSSFDSIIHILWCTAISDDSYGLLIKFPTTDNKTLDFIGKLINNENPDLIFKERALIMRSLSKIGICRSNADVEFGIESIHLTLCGTPLDVWKMCLDTEPSEERFYECDDCGKYIKKIPALFPDFKRLPRTYDELQEALPFFKTLKKVSCRGRSCTGSCVVTATPNFHLFIDLPQGSPESSLDAIPRVIQRESDYRLAGIIAYTEDRYVAYCCTRVNWLLYDGHSSAIQTVSCSAKIQPKCLIYVVKESQPVK